MRETSPTVTIIARTMPDDDAIVKWLINNGAEEFAGRRHFTTAEDLIEFAGRMCYRSYVPGLNLNVKKIRKDQEDYLRNILLSRHGSVVEHASWTFVLHDVSRVLTHELARHRVGVAVSQESMRYVRKDDIPMWFPSWALEDRELMEQIRTVMPALEGLQKSMTKHFDLDAPGTPFAEKKSRTSFMRRFLPEGISTSLTWTANIRTLRHVIETRTDPGAEEEMRLVFWEIGKLMREESPALFGDFEDHDGHWKPAWSKV